MEREWDCKLMELSNKDMELKLKGIFLEIKEDVEKIEKAIKGVIT